MLYLLWLRLLLRFEGRCNGKRQFQIRLLCVLYSGPFNNVDAFKSLIRIVFYIDSK